MRRVPHLSVRSKRSRRRWAETLSVKIPHPVSSAATRNTFNHLGENVLIEYERCRRCSCKQLFVDVGRQIRWHLWVDVNEFNRKRAPGSFDERLEFIVDGVLLEGV